MPRRVRQNAHSMDHKSHTVYYASGMLYGVSQCHGLSQGLQWDCLGFSSHSQGSLRPIRPHSHPPFHSYQNIIKIRTQSQDDHILMKTVLSRLAFRYQHKLTCPIPPSSIPRKPGQTHDTLEALLNSFLERRAVERRGRISNITISGMSEQQLLFSMHRSTMHERSHREGSIGWK